MADLHKALNAQQLNPQPTPTPVLPTDAPTNNPTWNTLTSSPAAPSVPSSTLDNPGVAHPPPASSPNVAPHTNDPAFIITTADARTTYQWPDGSFRQYPVNLTAENLAYGTGPLYANAGGFGSNQNSGGTGPGQTYNANSFAPGVGFALVPNNSPYK